MTGKGSISHSPQKRFRFLLIGHLIWLGIALVLGVWWSTLLISKSSRIAELESQLGIATHAVAFAKTQRMIYWESATLFLLLIVSTASLFWLSWRDLKRARSLQGFFASVTHELRTPLTSIRLQAESIAEGSPDQALIQRLLEDTARLESQVEKTLELARIEGGGPLFLQNLRLKPWIERTVELLMSSYSQRFAIEGEIEDVSVQADPSAIQTILKNLLENSLRHSKQERVIWRISSENGAPDLIRLQIRDNGPGYRGKSATKLGQIFQKGELSQGAGVGLYLIRVLMQRMGGNALFGSGPGFPVTLEFRRST